MSIFLKNIKFTGLKINNHFLAKYGCFEWCLKSVLESYGVKNADLILGINFNFYYDYFRDDIFVKNSLSDKSNDIYSSLRIIKKNVEKIEDTLNTFIYHIKSHKPIIAVASAYSMPSHNVFEAIDAAGQYITRESRIREIQKHPKYNSSVHYIIISGWNKLNNHFHVSDLFHTERAPFQGWISADTLIESIEQLPSINLKNTWFEIEFEQMEFIFDLETFHRIIYNIVRQMTSDYDDGRITTGIYAMKLFNKNLMNYHSTNNDLLVRKEAELFDSFRDVVMQREAFIGFIMAVEDLLDINLSGIKDPLMDNYNDYVIIRNLLLKASKKNPKSSIDKISHYFTNVINREVLAVKEMQNILLNTSYDHVD